MSHNNKQTFTFLFCLSKAEMSNLFSPLGNIDTRMGFGNVSKWCYPQGAPFSHKRLLDLTLVLN